MKSDATTEVRNKNTDQDPDIVRTLGMHSSAGRTRHLKRWLVLILLALLATFVAIRWSTKNGEDKVQYETRTAQRGNFTITVTATGNLEPINQVDVSSELSGIVETVKVDYNDHVKIGQVLAILDTSKLRAQVLQSKATLASARAKVLQAQATIRENRSELARLKEVRRLSNSRAVSQQDLDAAQAALDRALAEEAGAEASVAQAQANLEVNETDLSKASIRSPINGVVLIRAVEPGQTVASSLQAPVLFTLAEDLSKMELCVDVDEADVGQISEGQEAVFTVDAYPDRHFPAKITQVRYGSKTVDGVVTYETVLNVDNTDLSLRPGMTATADITVKKVEDALLVPNTALRFAPPEKEKTASSGGGIFRFLFRPPISSQKKREDVSGDKRQQRVWTLQGGQPVAIPVMVGSTDGSVTEIVSGDIKPGTVLIVDTVSTAK